MLSDRRVVATAAVLHALIRAGRAGVSLTYPSRGLLSVQLILSGRGRRALIATLFSRNLAAGRHHIALLLSRADRTRLIARETRRELIVVFRPASD